MKKGGEGEGKGQKQEVWQAQLDFTVDRSDKVARAKKGSGPRLMCLAACIFAYV